MLYSNIPGFYFRYCHLGENNSELCIVPTTTFPVFLIFGYHVKCILAVVACSNFFNSDSDVAKPKVADMINLGNEEILASVELVDGVRKLLITMPSVYTQIGIMAYAPFTISTTI